MQNKQILTKSHVELQENFIIQLICKIRSNRTKPEISGGLKEIIKKKRKRGNLFSAFSRDFAMEGAALTTARCLNDLEYD